MIIEMLAFIAFAIVLMLLILYFYYRDRGIVKQLELYQVAIEDLDKRLHKVEQKESSSSDNGLENITKFSKELEKIEDNLNGKLDELSDPLLKTIRAIKEMEAEIKRINESVNERIDKLEANSKLSSMSNNAKLINEKAIVELYKAGYSAEEIAKRERTPLGEVELILRIANLR